LDEGNDTAFSAAEVAPILAVLEQQLVELDRLDVGIAAAHLDAAIQQLRFDQASSSKV